MAIKFFGQYLLEKNIIKPNELIEAVEFQEHKNLRFGDYALLKGYITDDDVERFLHKQQQVDMMFGELAIKLGMLTAEQVEEILLIQKNDHVLIGEVLVQKGFITKDVLEKELSLFKSEQRRYDSEGIITPPGIDNPEIVKEIVTLSQKMIERIVNINTRIEEGYVSSDEPDESFLIVSILLFGKHKYEYVLSASQEISKLIASAVIGKDIMDGSREIISEGVKEFCNIVCGNIIAKLSQKGKSMDIKPPEEIVFASNGYNLVRGRTAIYYPLASPKGLSTLILIEG